MINILFNFIFLFKEKFMCKIKNIHARQILDSRGIPTIETKIILEDCTISSASVPSGKSTGQFEAIELLNNHDLGRFLLQMQDP